MHTNISISLAFVLLASSLAHAQKLLPFQGYLTTANGQQIADGTKAVQFKIYDTPVSGTTVWAGEVHKLSVNRGLVNTILGTKTTFPETYADGSKVMFSEPLYIEITVDANNDSQITAADPPLLPRQILLPANFAHVAHSIRSSDGDEIISSEGIIDGSRLSTESISPEALKTIPLNKLGSGEGNQGISSDQIRENAVTGSELAPNSVNSIHITNGQIMSDDIGQSQITAPLLAPGIPGNLLQAGSIPTNRVSRELAYFWEEQPFNVAGGTNVAGVQTRKLNKEKIYNTDSITREGNQIILKTGVYQVSATAPAYQVNRHQAHLFNVTNDKVALVGTSEHCDSTDGTISTIKGLIEVTAESERIEVRHYMYRSYSHGLGISMGGLQWSGTPVDIPSVYTQIHIEKIE